MDATRLPAPAGVVLSATADAVAGRFVPSGLASATPTGELVEASDTQTGAPVWLKLVPPAVLPTQGMADRALRELKQLTKVTSERLVRVVDQGRLPDGRIYVATERVDGARSLEELVAQEGPLAIERARSVVMQVGEALTEAQKVGVIHRDVAPRNIWIGPGDQVKVGDFGLAEPVNERVYGAPAYVSPEQAEGKPVDQRSNIYSLGAVYYFALAGEPPFHGDAASLIQQHLSAAAPPPSTKRHGLGAEVDRIILKALEKSGGRRHLTLRQLLNEIGAGVPGVQQRAEASAKTVMADAPVLTTPEVSARTALPHAPARADGIARTVMGIPSPIAKSPTGRADAQARTVMAEAPRVATPIAPEPQRAAPQARTIMTEAPSLVATPIAKAPEPQRAAPQARTVMAEAPSLVATPIAKAPEPAPEPRVVVAEAKPIEPQRAAPQAKTMMTEAPSLPVAADPEWATAEAKPIEPQRAEPQRAEPQAKTVMAEAPSLMAVAPASVAAPPTIPVAPVTATVPAAPIAAARPAAAAPAAASMATSATAAGPAAAKAVSNQSGKRGAFRETAWFKRGELEEELARVQATSSSSNPLESSGSTGKLVPLDESQIDLDATDHARLSLKTGATQAMPVIKGGPAALPGERMNEAEMIAEFKPSRRWVIIAAVLVAAIAIGLGIFFVVQGGGTPKAAAPPPTPEAVAASPPTAAPPAHAPPATSPTAPASPLPASASRTAPPAAPTAAGAPAPTGGVPITATPTAAGPATPTAAAPAPAPSPSATPVRPTLAEVSALTSRGELGAAADALDSLGRDGVAPRERARVAGALEHAVAAHLKTAHRHKDRAVEAQDRALLRRVHALAKRK